MISSKKLIKSESNPKYFLVYCTLAGLLASIGISGLLFLVDVISQAPIGTFFAVIGVSLGYYDYNIAPYIGLVLHIATGTVAGNLLGQGVILWNKLNLNNFRRGIVLGIITGVSLWIVLFLPLATFIIQPKLDSFYNSAPNQYVFQISQQFTGLYLLVTAGALFFHIVYGAILGFLAGRFVELNTSKFTRTNQL